MRQFLDGITRKPVDIDNPGGCRLFTLEGIPCVSLFFQNSLTDDDKAFLKQQLNENQSPIPKLAITLTTSGDNPTPIPIYTGLTPEDALHKIKDLKTRPLHPEHWECEEVSLDNLRECAIGERDAILFSWNPEKIEGKTSQFHCMKEEVMYNDNA